MSKKELLKESQIACENVAKKIKVMEESPTPLQIKVMIEQELDLGLSEDEITVLAITFRYIDNLFEEHKEEECILPEMMYA